MKSSLQHSILLGCAVFLLVTEGARADDPRPIISSASEIEDSMDQGFTEPIAPETKFEDLLKSSEVSLKLRNYYLNRSKPNKLDSVGWAQGGILSHKMGRVGGIFSMTTEFMGSYPLYNPEDQGGTLLLNTDQDAINTLGVLNPRLTVAGQVLSLYRQRYNLPYVNEQDNRMLPNTFEGYTLGMPIATSKNFQYILGYIDSMKKRDSGDFVSMSDAAGVGQIDRGMLVGGARAYLTPDWSLAAINYYVSDILNISYGETVFKSKFCEDVENTFSAQYSNQSSVGDNLLRGKDYSTGFWGVQEAASFKGIVVKLAGTFDNKSADIRSPYGSYPGYNSVTVEDFNRAGENSWQLGVSYDLANVGLKGFKLSTAFVQGYSALDENTGEGIANKNETDATLDYRVTEGKLNGLWVRLRSAIIDDEDAGTTQDFRAIVNYEIALWGPEKPAV